MQLSSLCLALPQVPSGLQREALAATLAQDFMPVNLNHPGLELLHQDPPIFAVHDFLSPEQCADFIEAAAATGMPCCRECTPRHSGCAFGNSARSWWSQALP